MSNRVAGEAQDIGKGPGAGLLTPGWAAPAILFLVATFLGYAWVLDLDHLGWDAWPLIASTHLEGPGDLLGLFTTEFMGDLFPDGHFYRPLTSLSFAVDGLLWGTRSAGFHHTDLLLLALNTLAVFHLSRRLSSTGSRSISSVAAYCAAALFLLHPLQVELLPAAPRRADALCLLFTLLALSSAVRPLSQTPARRWLLALLITAAALSKETGLLALPLVTLVTHLRSEESPDRLRRTIYKLLPAIAVLAAALVLRTLVLSGLGGYDGGAPERGGVTGLAAIADLPTNLGEYAKYVLYPQPLFTSPSPGPVLVLLCSSICLAAVGCLRARPRAHNSPILFLMLWLAGTALVSSAAGRVSWWYGLQFLPPLVLLLAQFMEHASAALSKGKRMNATLLGLVALACALPLVSRSGALVEYTEWQRGSAATQKWLAHAHSALEPARQGARVTLVGMPVGVDSASQGPAVHSAALLAPYSLVAWLEIHFPGRTFRLMERQGQSLDAGPQDTGRLPIHIEFTRRLVP
jgi:hypothetical protein